MIIGGKVNEQHFSQQSFFLNLAEGEYHLKLKDGPKLIEGRQLHGCAAINQQRSFVLFLLGKFVNQFLYTT
jgi:hypothetical protein